MNNIFKNGKWDHNKIGHSTYSWNHTIFVHQKTHICFCLSSFFLFIVLSFPNHSHITGFVLFPSFLYSPKHSRITEQSREKDGSRRGKRRSSWQRINNFSAGFSGHKHNTLPGPSHTAHPPLTGSLNSWYTPRRQETHGKRRRIPKHTKKEGNSANGFPDLDLRRSRSVY